MPAHGVIHVSEAMMPIAAAGKNVRNAALRRSVSKRVRKADFPVAIRKV